MEKLWHPFDKWDRNTWPPATDGSVDYLWLDDKGRITVSACAYSECYDEFTWWSNCGPDQHVGGAYRVIAYMDPEDIKLKTLINNKERK